MFTAIHSRDTAVDACAQALRSAVLTGKLHLAERLPPERALARTFKVNRETARQALRKLVDEGLLTVRQGSGYLVRDWVRAGGPELVGALVKDASPRFVATVVQDLLEVRRGVARVVLERIAQRKPSEEALRRVEAAVDSLEHQADRLTPEALAEADLDVLSAVVACTGSIAMQLALNPIDATLRSIPGLARAMFAAPKENVEGWKMLEQWLHAPSARSIDGLMGALEAVDAATVKALRKELA